jgi:predicted O-methyltransferase YrrM
MPLRVRWFLWRARRLAKRSGHEWGLQAATGGGDLAELLSLARGRELVVELGTGPGWTAIALALDDPARRVVTYDPVEHENRAEYLALAGDAAARIEWVAAEGASGATASAEPVPMLFVDSTHEREPTLEEFAAWRPRLAPGAVVAFHDYGHPEFPGVEEAVRELGLEGERRGGMFVWRAP